MKLASLYNDVGGREETLAHPVALAGTGIYVSLCDRSRLKKHV
jgi:hypothetical protein